MTRADAIEVLRQRSCEKRRAQPANVLPMFVAEMDYPLAPAIREALHSARWIASLPAAYAFVKALSP